MKKIFSLLFSVCFFIANSQNACTHTFNMYDSYDDGWNGASVNVTVNGTTVVSSATGSVGSSSGTPAACGTENFQASSGDAVALTNWVSGQYDGEISWNIKDGNGTVIASGGTMANGGGFGLLGPCTGDCPSVSVPCTHTFNMYDLYDDGWNGATVDVTVNGIPVVNAATGTIGLSTGTPAACGTENFQASSGDAVALTNWVSGQYDGEISWNIKDGNGTVIASGGTMANGGGFGLPGTCTGDCPTGPPASWDCDASTGTCSDPGTGNGQYITLLDCQNACGTVTASWDCVNGVCIDPGNGNGGYNDSLFCVTNCIAASWDCVNGVCTDPGNGSGTYNDSIVCVASCFPDSWDCNNTTGVCFDPGTGNGQHPTLLDCQNVCVATASWNCISPGNCQDPGNGSGTFSTLAACQSSCVPTISMDNDVPVNFMIFTDRTGMETPTNTTSGVSVSITPHASNPRNYLNPGRTVRFKVGVTNQLPTNLTSALITLTPSIPDQYITVITNQVGLNNVISNETEFTGTEFEIEIDNLCPPGHVFYANFEISNQITQTSYYNVGYPIVIEPFVNVEQNPIGTPPGTAIDDDSNPDSNGDNDHIVDPNETIEITPVLEEAVYGLMDRTDLNGTSSGFNAFPGSEDPLLGCLLNTNNYIFINIWDNVAGATGTNVVSCLPHDSISNSNWIEQTIQGSDYLMPGVDYVFDFTNNNTCKFDLFVEFEAAMTWNVVPTYPTMERWNDRIRWLSKITINPNESPCTSTASWDCISPGNCTDPGTGQGQYSTQAACLSACTAAASWDCDTITGTCSDPGTGQGMYSTQAACQIACGGVAPSWDCISPGNCQDPGTGQGMYTTQAACVASCNTSNILSYTINSNKLFPNPFKERALLELQDDVTHNILLFDVMGKLLREYKDINNDKLIIERGSLSSGTYLLKIINNSEIRIKKLIIE